MTRDSFTKKTKKKTTQRLLLLYRKSKCLRLIAIFKYLIDSAK